ncbi:hypothetical protein [Streptomyces sp. NPDC004589]|uniref:hypothetical protein n=1 Tax=Streptomyces sp. NPDC004589 TaxID=3154553 RepID=UPI0033A71DDE
MVQEDETGERTDPFVQLSLRQLRERTSMKWRTFPEDVLPLWVAEMDVPLAPAIVEALHRTIDLCFNSRMTSYSSSPYWRRTKGAMARPVPCSALSVPPASRTRSTMASVNRA